MEEATAVTRMASSDNENEAPPREEKPVAVSIGEVSLCNEEDEAHESPQKKQATTKIATSNTDLTAFLQELRNNVDTTTVCVLPFQRGMTRRQLCDWSVLRNVLEKKKEKSLDWPSILQQECSSNPSLDRAIGCLVGMVCGDSVGAPLEFTPANNVPIEKRNATKGDRYVQFQDNTLKYTNEKNAFALERGQWTDDASMGLCLAESLLAQGHYHGGDVRCRFHLWWCFGYCNAFRHSPLRPGSVGLGGNIGASLQNLEDRYLNKQASHVPGRYEATGEDAGNGSLMRLAAVPIRYHNNVQEAMNMAEESSYSTHPGPDAAQCCRFVAFFVCRALHRDNDNTINVASYTQQIITEFLQHNKETNAKLQALLHSRSPSPKEASWNWKAAHLAIAETLANRGRQYNGYPVSAGYFGSYCMDGLAMALWALTHSTSFSDCILKTVNLQGDADTTGAIAGQLAGAFYGYQSFLGDPCYQQMIRDIRQWDPLYELEVRAVLLYKDGEGQKEEEEEEEDRGNVEC